MVKLNTEQGKLRDRIVAAKRKYDNDIALIEAAYVNAKEEAKQPIRQLVGEARDSGMPVRQIHLAAGFAQVSSLQSFLLPSVRLGGSMLYTGDARQLGNPIIAAQEAAAKAKPEFRQERGTAYWVDPVSGEEKKIERIDGPVYFYYITDYELPKLTEQERAWFADDAKTLMGEAEYDEYFTNGNEPARWATQPDAKMRIV